MSSKTPGVRLSRPRALPDNVAVAIVSDPVGFAEAVVGIDNWRKALDPNVPVGERVCRALYGAIDATLNFASGGTKVAVKGMEVGIDGVRVIKGAETATDAAKAAKGIEAGLDAAKQQRHDSAATTRQQTQRTSPPSSMTRPVCRPGKRADWLASRKADRLAEAIKSGEPSEIKKALVECQKDKHAIGALNRADDSVKLAYNQQMKELITDDVDKVVKEKIAQRYGLDPKDVEIVKPTNPTRRTEGRQ